MVGDAEARGPLRLLVSARDPGAAQVLLPVLARAAADRRLELCVVAQEPAAGILRRAGFEVGDVRCPALVSSSSPNASNLLDEADEILRRTAPHALLAGLSGPGIGIDEALLVRAKSIATYTIQDYPGYRVEGFGVRAL